MELPTVLFSPATSVLTTIIAAFIVYKYLTQSFTYFSCQNIPGPKPVPIFGNMWGIWKRNLPEYDQGLMRKYGKVLGYFNGPDPNIWITDTRIIHSIFIKHFDHFVNRRDLSLHSKVIREFSSEKQDWNNIHSSLAPAFSPEKLILMSALIKECADRLANKFLAISQVEGKFNAKALMSSFSVDVLTSCAFGKTSSEVNGKGNAFTHYAKTVFGRSKTAETPLSVLSFIYPKLSSFIGESLSLTPEFQFFIDFLKNTVKNSKQDKEVACTNGCPAPLWNTKDSDEIRIAQSTLFLLAGFDTMAAILTNAFYHLARNQNVQEKLYDEIMMRLEQCERLNSEESQDMFYIDQVINEVLRLHPALPRVERVCANNIILNDIKIKKGMFVTVPTYALHYDPDYYPDPLTFNPERWSTENKLKIDPMAFMPFGMGPGACLGLTFAKQEIRIALCTLVKQFRLFPVTQTPMEIRPENGFFNITQPTDIILGIEVRR